ncbi:probable palmitoyltransferase ZDHHC21 [Lingula anatina]|uniref:Palmitoyltransferase n=1 Tax=Lingula anatina TaxID=7574 RepID=A0A1S3IIU8_LINAN|nr:probable palmitoyltransferase ZDHHC21 [Lingula anatina]|eukprot:XP_013398043.1 probable palmitoyltransferase ZDHHC21 [Lingula anatina]
MAQETPNNYKRVTEDYFSRLHSAWVMEESGDKTMGEVSSNVTVHRCPVFGRLHFVRDQRGIACLSFIVLYWIYGVWSMSFLIIYPRYQQGLLNVVAIALYAFCSVMTICSLFKAATTNPGRVPLVEQPPVTDADQWTFCQKCKQQRPTRAHHCRRCQQCVMKMDHHCPWINNCVGEANHFHFMQLCTYAFLMSLIAFVMCMVHWYLWPKCPATICDKSVYYMRHQQALLYFSTFLSFLMAFSMLLMVSGQHFNLIMDRTTLDNLRDPFGKDQSRPLTLKFRTCHDAYTDLCGPGHKIFWAFPCRRRKVLTSYHYYGNPV